MRGLKAASWLGLALWLFALPVHAAPLQTTVRFEVEPNALQGLHLVLVETTARSLPGGTHRASVAFKALPGAVAEVAIAKMEIDVWAPNGEFLGQVVKALVLPFPPGDSSLHNVFFESSILPGFQLGSTIVFRVYSGFLLPGVAANDPRLAGYEARCEGGFVPAQDRCDAIQGALSDALCGGRPLRRFYCQAAELHPLERSCHYPDVFVDWDRACR